MLEDYIIVKIYLIEIYKIDLLNNLKTIEKYIEFEFIYFIYNI